MDELEKKIPIDSWRKTFNDAAETPPPRVWDAIERHLDESTDAKIVPLWGTGLASSRPLLWGTGLAAAVALLLVGWWLGHTSAGNQEPLLPGHHQTSIASRNSLQRPLTKPIVQASKPVETLTKGPAKSTNKPAIPVITVITTQPNVALAQQTVVPSTPMPMPVSGSLLNSLPETSHSFVNSTGNAMPVSEVSHLATTSFIAENRASLTGDISEQVKTLSGKPIRRHEFGQIYRIVWFQPAEQVVQPENTQSKQQDRALWASASVMPSAFNPMVSVQTASVASSYAGKNASVAAVATQAQSINSRSTFSIAYQASAGKQLTQRWSVEMGVGYLAGRSLVDTPAQLPASSIVATLDRSTTAGNLYTDALRNSVTIRTATASLDQANFANSAYNSAYISTQPAYSDQNRKVLTNDYQFVQVPVQVGYQLRPRKKLNLAVLGGIISNIFVRNTVDNEVVISAKDGIYRPVSFAAIMGARFRYQYSPQWSASLAGIYQPSIGLITQAHSQVQSQPTTAGMTVGVDYHF